MNIALIDIGSNSIKLLIVEDKYFSVVCEKFCECRLSNVDQSISHERILEEIFDAGIKNVQKFIFEAKSYFAEQIIIVGTSFLRRAENARDFCLSIYEKTGFPVRIISGEEEARYLFKGVLTDLRFANLFQSSKSCVCDLGGGSLEIISNCDENEASFVKSFDFGPISVARKLKISLVEKITASDVFRINEMLGEKLNFVFQKKIENVVFCSGSLAVANLILKVNGRNLFEKESFRINLAEIDYLLEMLLNKTLLERERTLGMPKSRADILPIALIIFRSVIENLDIKNVYFSNRNMRYGILSSFCERDISDSKEG